MATPYQLAALSNAVYPGRPSPPGWQRRAYQDDPNGFYGAMYESERGERVVAFRGSDPQLNDWLSNAEHFFVRASQQIESSLSFFRSLHQPAGTIVTGHSLGGFLACNIAFQNTVRACSFNAPWPSFLAAGEWVELTYSRAFESSKLLVYQSNDDAASGFLPFRQAGRYPNVLVRNLGCYGWHAMEPIVARLSAVGNYEIHWTSNGEGWPRNQSFIYYFGFVAMLFLRAANDQNGTLDFIAERAVAPNVSRNRRRGSSFSHDQLLAKFDEGFAHAGRLIAANRFSLDRAINNYYAHLHPKPGWADFSRREMRIELAEKMRVFSNEYPYVAVEDGWCLGTRG